ncbi:MAG TPA: hypothetical protein VGK35_07040 [Actinotalea sp.]|jgi:hypothetical protein
MKRRTLTAVLALSASLLVASGAAASAAAPTTTPGTGPSPVTFTPIHRSDAADRPAAAATSQADGLAAAPVAPGGRFIPTDPYRLIDTRYNGDGALSPQFAWFYDLSAMPLDVTALVLNVTSTQGTANSSYVTVMDDFAIQDMIDFHTIPATSSLNTQINHDVANLVTVPLDGERWIGLYNNAGWTQLIVDVEGYYSSAGGAGFVPTDPTRVLDTRDTFPLISYDSRNLTFAAAPANAVGVALTITSTHTTAPTSWVGAWPLDADVPGQKHASSVLNTYPGSDIPNLAVVQLGASKTITLYNNLGVTNLVVDVVGWYVSDGGADYFPVSAQRALGSGSIGQGGERAFTMVGAGVSVPEDADAVALNLTTTHPTASSYLTLYPTGTTRPLASNANTRLGADVATAAFVRLAPGFTLFNNAGTVDALIDVEGYFDTVN